MKKRRSIGLKMLAAGALVYIASLSSSFAAIVEAGTYQLLDHPDAQLAEYGSYGLRLDFLDDDIEGLGSKGPTFSLEQGGAAVFLEWNGSNSATISGTILNNTTEELWTVQQIFVDPFVAALPQGGFLATAGTLTLTDPLGMMYILDSKQNDQGIAFSFAANNHRCAGHEDCGPITAVGWIMEEGTNDWIAQARLVTTPVPVPAALPLFLSAIVGLIGFKKLA